MGGGAVLTVWLLSGGAYNLSLEFVPKVTEAPSMRLLRLIKNRVIPRRTEDLRCILGGDGRVPGMVRAGG